MNMSDDNNPSNNPSQNNPSQDNNQNKKGKGRQKVNMAKIENETNLQVTFSKRRAGLFKKASELSTLCGAESAVVVFSPGGKAHSFGHPDVETVADMFLNTNVPSRSTDPLLMAHSDAIVRQQNQELTNIEAQLEQEKQRKREQESLRKASQSQNWRPPSLDELNYEQLDQLQRTIMTFKQEFENKVENAASLSSANPYVQGSNPEAGIGGDAPWTTPTGPGIGFPMDSNIQWPSHQFPPYDYMAPMFPHGSTNPIAFDGGAGHGIVNVANATNPGAGSSSLPSVFPNSFVDPFDPNAGNYGYTVQYPHTAGASGSDFLLPYNYGNPSNVVPYSAGTSSSNVEPADGGTPMETQADDQNKFQGFNNNFGRRNP